MSTYNRRGVGVEPNETAPPAPMMAEGADPKEQQIKVDGFEQVLAMLKVADPEFRESLIRRLAARDRELATALVRELRSLGIR